MIWYYKYVIHYGYIYKCKCLGWLNQVKYTYYCSLIHYLGGYFVGQLLLYHKNHGFTLFYTLGRCNALSLRPCQKTLIGKIDTSVWWQNWIRQMIGMSVSPSN